METTITGIVRNPRLKSMDLEPRPDNYYVDWRVKIVEGFGCGQMADIAASKGPTVYLHQALQVLPLHSVYVAEHPAKGMIDESPQ